MDALEQLNLAAAITGIYTEVETALICHIARQLGANPDTLINSSSEWRLQMLARMGRLNKDTAKIISSKVGKVPDEVEGVINAAIAKVLKENNLEMTDRLSENIHNALKNYDRQAIIDKYNQVNTVMQYKAKQVYKKGVNAVADRFDRMMQEKLPNSQEYLDILNKQAMAVTLGETSRTQAVRETIREMSEKGIPAFVDAAGREWSPEAYVNMDIRNTVKNTAIAAEFASMDELGQDIVLFSSHSGARPKCAPHQGKLYSRSGKSGTIKDARGKEYKFEPLGSTSFGEPDGIIGVNCGHRMRGVSAGTFINREEQYSEDECSEEYKKVCKQRQMERKIRADKRTKEALEAAGDTEGAKELKKKITAENKQLRAYCEQEGLTYRQDRTQVYGYKIKRETITVPRPTEDNSQFYKPIVTSDDDKIVLSRNKGSETVDITAKRLIGRNNTIYLSDRASIKPKALHELDTRATEVYKMLGVTDNKNLPRICVISDKEMLSHAPAAYNAIENVLYFNDKYDKIELSDVFKSQMACSDNPLSTMLHEALHWKDAQDYIRKFGKVKSLAELNRYENDLFKKRLDELERKGYNISGMSRYAVDMYYSLVPKYYETYTEYRVLQILKG